MTEAAVVLPVIILAAALILRMFVFYLEITVTGAKAHLDVMKIWDEADTTVVEVYQRTKTVNMLSDRLLAVHPRKNIEIRAYMFNEDRIVRAGVLADGK